MSDREVLIRLFAYGATPYEDYGEDYTVADFGGVIPSIGDLIVDPGAMVGLPRHVPANRTVYEVVHRYFRPSSEGAPRIALLVEERSGKAVEIDILGP